MPILLFCNFFCTDVVLLLLESLLMHIYISQYCVLLSGWSIAVWSPYRSHIRRDQITDCSWAWKRNDRERAPSGWNSAA